MATKYAGSREERRALDTFIKLARCLNSVVASVEARNPLPNGLSVSQFAVLEALYHLGSLSQRQVGAKILKTAGNVTTVVDNLEKKGLVRRRREPPDRRIVLVDLTDSGQELMATFFPSRAEAIRRTMSVLTANEQEELQRLCKKLGVGASREKCAPLQRPNNTESPNGGES